MATTTSYKSSNKKHLHEALAFRVHCTLPYYRKYNFDFIQFEPLPSSFLLAVFLLEAFVTIRIGK